MQIPVAAMAKTAGAICKNADMSSPSGRRPSADDLLVLLAVGRSGRYNTAAEELGINHTTISRRIAALEQSIGGRVLARVAGGWELTNYPLVYFIDSMLQVDDLDRATSFAPAMRESVTSTNVFVHVEATRADAGIGLLPCFMADRHDDLIRVLPDAVAIQLTYWLVARAETLRRPEVAAVVEAIRDRVHEQRDMLLGH